ncbi:MAG TPA: M20/M25/M40 family metallo-hydrolase [Thermoanaerobaculia bacterium]|nr:M20/M25/M40 family metallo-hydrolase [Thermoanaerobaculia bacterium]
MLRAIVILAFSFTVPAQVPDFRAEAIRAHMKFLASDLLEGRGAATRGHDLAAAYVAAQFEAAGLAPGAGESYYQVVPFLRTIAGAQSTVTLHPDRGAPLLLKIGDGFATSGDPLHAERTVSGSLVVAGYGVTAPELGHDDYAGIDVRGKIVVIFSGAPDRFEGTLRAHYSSSLGKIETAAAHGAAAVITVDHREEGDRVPWSRVVRQSRLGAMHWVDAARVPHGVNASVSHSLALDPDVFGSLLAAAGRPLPALRQSLERSTFRSFVLPMRATIRIVSSHELVESANVVGLVRGSDPALRQEYLVYSSHLDHLGISEPVDGDTINNGAFDNASGSAALIEIARAMAATRPAPRRSILFLATTAEEKGLRGADYFAGNPTVPAGGLAGNINIDQIMMVEAVRDVIVHGIDASSLGEAARTAAVRAGVEISPDPAPEEVVFVRSDQYAFIRRGIPALYIDAGYLALDAAVDAQVSRRKWVKERYHTPKDDLEQRLDYGVPAMVARFAFLVGLEAANADAAPAWLPGNFFGEKFGRGRR